MSTLTFCVCSLCGHNVIIALGSLERDGDLSQQRLNILRQMPCLFDTEETALSEVI